MEIIQYLCEFFFGNLWHWMGLVTIIILFALMLENLYGYLLRRRAIKTKEK